MSWLRFAWLFCTLGHAPRSTVRAFKHYRSIANGIEGMTGRASVSCGRHCCALLAGHPAHSRTHVPKDGCRVTRQGRHLRFHVEELLAMRRLAADWPPFRCMDHSCQRAGRVVHVLLSRQVYRDAGTSPVCFTFSFVMSIIIHSSHLTIASMVSMYQHSSVKLLLQLLMFSSSIEVLPMEPKA